MELLAPLLAFCYVSLCLAQTLPSEVPGGFLTPDDFDFEDAAEISDVNDNDPTLVEGLFEGDIVIKKPPPAAGPRSAVLDETKTWPNHEVPYLIQSRFAKNDRGTIAKAILAFHKNTCLRFVPRTTEKDYIVIRLGDANSSAVGRVGGQQDVTLMQPLYSGTVAHEFMHAIGFWHEHTRPDRDDFIKINWANVRPGMQHNFEKHETNSMADLGIGYDLNSITHYGATAFAKERNQKTIEVIGEGLIGQRMSLSTMDKEKINMLYNCPT